MMMYKRFSEGVIEIIVGPMFSGKSEELIKRIKRVGYAKISCLVIKPSIDDRWEEKKIISRAGTSIQTKEVDKAEDILKLWNEDIKVVAIDEAQFFGEELVDIVTRLANKGVRVIISALDQDAEGKPFGCIPNLLAIAEVVSKQTAVCMKCGRDATMSFRKINGGPQIQVGSDEYEARCRACHRYGTFEKTEELKLR